MVQIRPAAAQELKRLLHRHTAHTGSSSQIYLTLEPGGCADWTYQLTSNITPQRPLATLTCGEISLAVPVDQVELIEDLTIDYAEDLMGGGFRFTNPLAQRTCGCGNAFALSADTPVTQDCTAAHLPTP